MDDLKSFFRYPGGKSRIAKQIIDIVSDHCTLSSITDYREPFWGGGGMGLEMLEHLAFGSSIWINDKDSSLSALWQAIIENPIALTTLISSYKPRTEDFYEFKSSLQGENIPQPLKRLIIHQISYSGLGVMSGGPLGGKNQVSKYKIDCRWSPESMCKKIMKAHELLSKFKVQCSSYNYEKILEDVTSNTVIYLDPPYYVRGDQLYQEKFSVEEHENLSQQLKELKCNWFLSYDNCPEIRTLYSWANIIEIPVSYTINNNTKKNIELVITR